MNRKKEITMRPIGEIRTPFKEQAGTPVQGTMVPDAVGTVELAPEFAEGLMDLEGFSHLWLIYCFDRIRGWAPLVTPYLDTREHGIFATRSPKRPNHLGITCVRLLGIEGNTLRVGGVDMLDETPLLDLKPCVPSFDHAPVERIGWFQGKVEKSVLADGRFE